MEKEPDLNSLSESEQVQRVLKCIRTPDFNFLETLTHIEGNPFYKEEQPDDNKGL